MALTSRAFADLITFTRASSGTYFDSAGVMQTATTDVPRFNYEYNGSSWVAKGLRIEPAATNLLLRSTDLTNATNQVAGFTRTSATVVTEDTSTGGHRVLQLVTLAAGAHTLAFDVKLTGRNWIYVYADGGLQTAYINPATKTVGATFGSPSVAFADLPDNVVRVRFTWTGTSTIGQNVQVWMASANGTNSYTGDGSSTMYLTKIQLESGSVATSFIETTSATATRAADVAVISGSNFSSWYNQSAGSVVTYANSPGVGTRVIWQIDDGTANNRYTLYTTGTSLKFDVVTGGVTQASLTLGTITANTTFKAAVAFAANDIAGVLNGGTVQTDASATLPTVDRKRLGADATGNQLTGHIERDVHYPTRLENANLQSLST